MYKGDGLLARCIPRGLGERSLGVGLIATGDGEAGAGRSCFGTSAGAGWSVAIGRGDGADGAVWSFGGTGTGSAGIEDNEAGAVSLLDSGIGTGVASLIAAGGVGTAVIRDFIGMGVLSKYPGPGTADLTWGAA